VEGRGSSEDLYARVRVRCVTFGRMASGESATICLGEYLCAFFPFGILIEVNLTRYRKCGEGSEQMRREEIPKLICFLHKGSYNAKVTATYKG
jgi:hypothetical protein